MARPEDLPGVLGIPLSAEQLAAATSPTGPQLVVAGAGTGKTTVMAARVVWLVGTGQVRRDQVLGLTFTNKAATELRLRVRAALRRLPTQPDDEAADPAVMTYHAFAGQLLAEFGSLLGIEGDRQLLTEGQRARIAHQVACDPVAPTTLTGSPIRLAERIRLLDGALADLDIGTDEVLRFDEELLHGLATAEGPDSLKERMAGAATARMAATGLVQQFREAKAVREQQDFADQVRLASALAREAPWVGGQLRERYAVVLLDEYQDTSRGQRRMLQGLFAHGHPVTAVGDPCQAIYGWRGASVTNIDEFPRHFPSTSAAEQPVVHGLTVNRRSGLAVLAAANRISSDLRAFHEHVQPLRAPAGAGDAGVTCALLPSWDSEIVWLGEQVSQAAEAREWGDIAVLCRSNDQVGAVVGHLRDLGVPVQVSARQNVLSAPEVRAVTSLLRILVDPFANPEVVHQLTGPRWRIGPRDLALLGRRARELAQAVLPEPGTDPEISLLAALDDPGPARYSDEARERFAGFVAEVDRLSRFRSRSAAEAVAEALEILGPSLLAADAPPTAHPAAIGQFVDLAGQFRSVDGSRSLTDFVHYLIDCERFQAPPVTADPVAGDGVHVMTMHAAKGLEFPVVAVPFLSRSVFPDTQGGARWPVAAAAVPPVAADEPDIGRALGFPGEHFTTRDYNDYVAASQESERLDEDRLAYVAVTRAKDHLIASGHWWGPTQSRPRGPSPYLLAVREAALAGHGAVDTWQEEAGDRAESAAGADRSAAWPVSAQEPAAAELADRVRTFRDDGHVVLPDEWESAVRAMIAAGRADDGGTAAPVPEVVSASQLVQWHQDGAAFARDARRPMPRRPSPAAERGNRFHEWVEHRLGQQTLFEITEIEPGGAGDQEPAPDFEQVFDRTRFADVVPQEIEYPFVVAVGDLVVTGRIDAVFAAAGPDHDWEVVDWKTGRPGRADPLQLAIYARAWAAATGTSIERVKGTFVFVSDGSEESFDELPDPVTIAARLGGDRVDAGV